MDVEQVITVGSLYSRKKSLVVVVKLSNSRQAGSEERYSPLRCGCNICSLGIFKNSDPANLSFNATLLIWTSVLNIVSTLPMPPKGSQNHLNLIRPPICTWFRHPQFFNAGALPCHWPTPSPYCFVRHLHSAKESRSRPDPIGIWSSSQKGYLVQWGK